MAAIIRSQFMKLPYPSTSSVGKTVIITGANIGLGLEAARHHARLGASRLILAVRSLDKGNAAKREIELTTKCGKDVIRVWQLDMGNYASVQNFAAQVEKDLDRVDIFIANAGVAPAKFELVEDNESAITINVVSTFFLLALVLPKLKHTAAAFNTRPNFSIVSSGVHGFTKFPQKAAAEGQIFAKLNDKAFAEKHWMDQYQVSKLLEIYGVRAIAEQHPASAYPVTVNCLDPGLCKTTLSRYEPFSMKLIMLKLMIALMARTPEMGSRNLVYAGSQGAETHGQYLADCKITPPAPIVTSDEGQTLQKRVWNELLQKLESIKPGVTSNF